MNKDYKIYSHYSSINRRMAAGEQVVHERPLHYPKIGVYAGAGASHSWLWFVDLFDRTGFYDLVFLDEYAVQNEGLDDLDVLVMSGGDTFAIAEALGPLGSEKLAGFVRKGGLYLGSCAGAYLPMNSSKEYLNLFNYADVRIANLTRALPEVKRIPAKFCTAYGCSFVFHPVREDVKLAANGVGPFKGAGIFNAPMYGGPVMWTSGDADILAYYKGFTDKTVFLVDRDIAEKTMEGRAAVIRKRMGKGHIYMFGPHLEHPRFPAANRLVAEAVYWDMKPASPDIAGSANNATLLAGARAATLIRDIKRELSNSRIAAFGMEMMPVSWLIGKKVYEPGKIREFFESMWKRLKFFEQQKRIIINNGDDIAIVQYGKEITSQLRNIKTGIANGIDTVSLAKDLFEKLTLMSIIFFSFYFKTRSSLRGDKS